ncbi:MAG: hypothetical protein IJX39_06065 [Clostridia bacterium]|nr:hypothetical protein [Clostridia bacterium]
MRKRVLLILLVLALALCILLCVSLSQSMNETVRVSGTASNTNTTEPEPDTTEPDTGTEDDTDQETGSDLTVEAPTSPAGYVNQIQFNDVTLTDVVFSEEAELYGNFYVYADSGTITLDADLDEYADDSLLPAIGTITLEPGYTYYGFYTTSFLENGEYREINKVYTGTDLFGSEYSYTDFTLLGWYDTNGITVEHSETRVLYMRNGIDGSHELLECGNYYLYIIAVPNT